MFKFLTYIRPIWYYRLSCQTRASLLTNIQNLCANELIDLVTDSAYQDERSTLMDAAYQAINAGYIPSNQNCIRPINIEEVKSVPDNYRFIRKHFSTQWYIYVFFIRLATLHNPFREVWNFVRHFNVPQNYNNKPASQTALHRTFSNTPLISIIIPTLNRYIYLQDALSDLEQQDYKNFEVIVCDQSDPVNETFYENWKLNITLIKQNEKALWLARNQSIAMSKGEYILLYDDDSRVNPNWITNHLACIEHFNVCISAGVTETVVGHGLSSKESYYHLSDVFDTGNAMVKREVFEKIGLFDRQFERQRMGDGEFGLRAILGGYQVISNPHAKRLHLKAESGGLRQMGSWDAFIPNNIWSPRPVPSVLYFARKYFGPKAAFYLLLSTLPKSLVPYRLKGNKRIKYLSLSLLPLMFPIIILQMLRSWHLSSEKLKAGPIIPQLS